MLIGIVDDILTRPFGFEDARHVLLPSSARRTTARPNTSASLSSVSSDNPPCPDINRDSATGPSDVGTDPVSGQARVVHRSPQLIGEFDTHLYSPIIYFSSWQALSSRANLADRDRRGSFGPTGDRDQAGPLQLGQASHAQRMVRPKSARVAHDQFELPRITPARPPASTPPRLGGPCRAAWRPGSHHDQGTGP